jgi:hypothetical protein
MADGKKSFLLYCDLIHTVGKLPNEEAGVLFKHILNYVNDKNPETNNLLVEVAFEPIKQQLKRDLLRWSDEQEKRKEQGSLGNLKRWHTDLFKRYEDGMISLKDAWVIAHDRNKSLPDSPQSGGDNSDSGGIPKVAVNVNDTVNVTVNDNVKNNIEERKINFASKIKDDFLESYSPTVLFDFIDYWTEYGEQDKKMRFEKEKSFSAERRLRKWNQNNFNGVKKDKPYVMPI